MAIGAGKYDGLCAYVREQTQAQSVLLVVFGGTAGSGFSVQAPQEILGRLPSILRTLANAIDKDRGTA